MDTERGVLNTGVFWGGWGRNSWGWGGLGGITWGEMPDIPDRGMEAVNHIAMYVSMQQSCMICTCTPEPKVQLKKKRLCQQAFFSFSLIFFIKIIQYLGAKTKCRCPISNNINFFPRVYEA